VKPVADPHFANLFFHLFGAAELDPCCTFRFARRHAARMFSSISISRWE